jgi:hypothetical protein
MGSCDITLVIDELLEEGVYYIKGTGGYLSSMDKLLMTGRKFVEGEARPADAPITPSFGTKEFAELMLKAFNEKFPNHNKLEVVKE